MAVSGWNWRILAALALVPQWPGGAAGAGDYAWQALVAQTHGYSEPASLQLVNRHINSLRRLSDRENWLQDDFWATPLELLSRGAGDCEDFALAKYYLLRAQGVPDTRLRLMIARHLETPGLRIRPHMVLLYLPPDSPLPLVLDNLTDDVRPLAARHDLVPSVAFTPAAAWIHDRGAWTSAHPAAVTRRWSKLHARWVRQLSSGLRAGAGTP